ADGGVEHNLLQRFAAAVGLGYADGDQIRVARQFATVIEDHIDGNVARIGKLPPSANAHRFLVAKEQAILEDAAEGHLVYNARLARRQAQQVAIAHLSYVWNAGFRAQRTMRDEMGSFAVNGNKDTRPRPFEHPPELVAARMARDMDQGV